MGKNDLIFFIGVFLGIILMTVIRIYDTETTISTNNSSYIFLDPKGNTEILINMHPTAKQISEETKHMEIFLPEISNKDMILFQKILEKNGIKSTTTLFIDSGDKELILLNINAEDINDITFAFRK